MLDVGEVDTGIGTDEPVTCLGDHEVTTTPQHAHRLRLDDAHSVGGVVGLDRHQAALGFGHDLLGDHDHVAVEKVHETGDDNGEIVAGADLAHSRDGEHDQSARSLGLRSRARLSGGPRCRGSGTLASRFRGGHLRLLGAGSNGRPASTRSVASAAAWSGVCMTVGATTQRTPQASTASADAESAWSTKSVPTKFA